MPFSEEETSPVPGDISQDAPPNGHRAGAGLICSSAADLKRFWLRVHKTSGCWLWTAATWGKGYGCFKLGRRNFTAHRISWLIHYGEIPPCVFVLHDCDVPLCVNPEHLRLGSLKDNARDASLRKRWRPAFGESHPRAKLKESVVTIIRSKFQVGQKMCDLAAEFKVDRETIRQVVCRRTWKHIP